MDDVRKYGFYARLFILAGMKPGLTEESLGDMIKLVSHNREATAALLRGWATRPQPETEPPIWYRLIGNTKILMGVTP